MWLFRYKISMKPFVTFSVVLLIAFVSVISAIKHFLYMTLDYLILYIVLSDRMLCVLVLCGSSMGLPFKSSRLLKILCSICKCCSPVVSIASIDKTARYRNETDYIVSFFTYNGTYNFYLRSQDIVGTIMSKLILNLEPLDVSTNNSSFMLGVR